MPRVTDHEEGGGESSSFGTFLCNFRFVASLYKQGRQMTTIAAITSGSVTIIDIDRSHAMDLSNAVCMDGDAK